MTLIRGTSDGTNPFYGEDLLSDYYGRTDGMQFTTIDDGTFIGTTGFAQFRVTTTAASPWDDVFAGRVLTFTESLNNGVAENQSYRVLRSISMAPSAPNDHLIIIEPHPEIDVTKILDGSTFWLNGVPRNSPGFGYDDTNINQAAVQQPFPFSGTTNPIGFPDLPAVLQPNHFGPNVDKSTIVSSNPESDFDEGYDAADFNNWFLSYRHDDNRTVIPSFHRPSVANYILNKYDTWESSSRTAVDYRDLMISLARGTMRPIPIAANQFGAGSAAINDQFTGGNTNFALRTPLFMGGGGTEMRLDQLAQSLITGPWDVDNDLDGIPDSIWMDLGLPLITAPDGKLLKPLVAPMIEDMSARLNVNAHHNSSHLTNPTSVNLSTDQARWAGDFTPPTTASVFRGLGYGPSEIAMPYADLAALVKTRQRSTATPTASTNPAPGSDLADTLDVLRTGSRPRTQTVDGGFGYSIDPYGRGGVGIGLSGHLVAAISGTTVATDDASTANYDESMDEALNDPYESDPTGTLSGDRMFNGEDLEAILRSNEFDTEMLPQRLRAPLATILASNPEIARSITTLSVSDDTPPPAVFGTNKRTAYASLASLLGTTDASEIEKMLAPEIRLGRKLDVNRPIGNGVDDNTPGQIGYGTIDEPREVAREVVQANNLDAFKVPNGGAGSIPSEFQGTSPIYNFGDTSAVNPRELLARHLYVLMMALTSDEDSAAFPASGSTSFDTDTEARYRARRIAQWAVNVVDYRDPDSIMTRFVFDPEPFDGSGWMPDSTNPETIVWGVEAPELMFSESLALHDVRVRDTDKDSSGKDKTAAMDPDPNTDSVRVPQGSLFLELYAPHPTVTTSDQATKPALPQELYNAEGYLDLAATAPGVGGASGAPVWRIAISEPHLNKPSADPDQLRAVYPDTASFDPANPDELGEFSDDKLEYERFIWFGAERDQSGPVDAAATLTSTDYADSADINMIITSNGITDMAGKADGVFFASDTVNDGDRRLLSPGQYLVLAPRETTYLGSRSNGSGTPLYPSRQRFQVMGSQIAQFRNADAVTNPPSEVRTSPQFGPTAFHTAPQTLIVGSFLPPAWNPDTFEHGVVGLSVSEPLHNAYYGSVPMWQYNGTTGQTVEPLDNDGFAGADYPLTDAYFDLGNPTLSQPINEPLDVTAGILPVEGEETRLGTLPTYCSAFLQRLADPTMPYDSVTNPYITVDWIPIDLTVFSGEALPTDLSQPDQSYASRSRQRNGDGANVLFSYETNDAEFTDGGGKQVDEASMTNLDFFNLTLDPDGESILRTSLGFVNTSTYFTTEPASTADIVQNGQCNGGFNGFAASIGSSAGTTIVGNDRNLPQTSFGVHSWLNRPFATPYELMMVPTCSAGRLFEEFGIVNSPNPSIYPSAPTGGTDSNPEEVYAPFRFALNVFHGGTPDDDPDAPDDPKGNNLFRLFDFVQTLPAYRGEVEMINPNRTNAANNPQMSELMSAPFNLIYDNRRQGRVNLNSISEPLVWDGLMQGHLTTVGGAGQFSFTEFKKDRRGYPVVTAPDLFKIVDISGAPVAGPYNYDPQHLDSELPTQFAGVFTDSRRAFLAPKLWEPPDDISDEAAQTRLRRKPIDGTLFRQGAIMSRGAGNSEENITSVPYPAFVRQDGAAPVGPQLDRGRSAFMRYQTLMRMPNLVSDNSQTFLIRMTVGFFEVDADNTTSLGREYGESMGQTQRHRAMFIIDRSIPVGFKPGQNLNARDTVVFERYYP